MNGWLELPNLVLSSAALILMVLGLLMAFASPGLERWNKRFFITLFSLMVLCVASGLAEQIFSRYPERMWVASKIALYLESLLASILTPLLTVFLLHSCGEPWRRSKLFRTVVGLWLVYFVLLGVTQFTTFIYYYTQDGLYYRGPWYALLLMPLIAVMAVNLWALSRRRKALSHRQFLAFLVYVTTPMASMVIQMFVMGLYFSGVGMALAALFMFVNILTDNIEQYIRQQQALARQQAGIMALQMRPHFIYNTLMSIYYLCQMDAEKAQRVTLDFTTYLRKNFAAIAKEGTIPFAEELEHTRAYLAVEKVRFEDKLLVEFDTPHTAFRLPPLTLQPIVENAVKHGVDPDLEPLHITIRTRAAGRGTVITVEDTGPGFAPGDNGTPHIALANIKQRLEMMCGGQMQISSREGGGTVVIVTILRQA